MRWNPFDFNGDGKVDALERAAEFAFLNDLLDVEETDEECSFSDEDSDDWDE